MRASTDLRLRRKIDDDFFSQNYLESVRPYLGLQPSLPNVNILELLGDGFRGQAGCTVAGLLRVDQADVLLDFSPNAGFVKIFS